MRKPEALLSVPPLARPCSIVRAVISRGLVLSVSALLLAVLPAGATQADTVVIGFHASAGEHAAGMPVTSDPWRSLTYAEASGSEFTDVIKAGATLGAAPPAGQTVTVTWILGQPVADGCDVLWQTSETVATLGADNRVEVERPLPPGWSQRPTCLEVVLSPREPPHGHAPRRGGRAYAPAGADAVPAGRLRLVPGRTTPAILMVTAHARGTSRVVVTASGAAVSMRPLGLGAMAAEEVRPVVARFRVAEPGRSQAMLTARDDRGSTSFDAIYPYAARPGLPKRPLSGRYAFADGRLAFRIRPDFSVTGSARHSVRDSTSHTARFPQDLKMPRGGVAAKVARSGNEWFGVQLMADKRYSVRVAFAYSSPTCSGRSTSSRCTPACSTAHRPRTRGLTDRCGRRCTRARGRRARSGGRTPRSCAR